MRTASIARNARLSLVVLALALLSARASAQGYQLSQYHSTPANERGLWVAQPTYSETLSFAAGLTLDYGHHPLLGGRIDREGEFVDSEPIVSDQLATQVDLALAGLDRIQAGLSLPVTLFEDGAPRLGVEPASGVVVGDPRMHATVRLVGHGDKDPIAMHLGATVWIPVGAEDDHAGDGRARVMPRVVLDGAAGEHVVWASNVGVLLREKASLNQRSAETGTVGNELQIAGALGFLVLDRRLRVGPELVLGSVFDDGRLFTQAGTHIEALASANYRLGTSGLQIGGGLGGGIVRTAGTPDFRALLRVAYAPTPAASMSEEDETEVVFAPEPVVAAAPPEPAPPPPAVPEPPPAAPPPPPPVALPAAVVEAAPPSTAPLGAIDPFYYSSGQTAPKDSSALERVAQELAAHPEVSEIRVEGHSDDSGSAEHNQQLSRQRARHVADVLAQHGVPADKVQIRAYGSSRPAMQGQSDAARTRNRRVEITHTP